MGVVIGLLVCFKEIVLEFGGGKIGLEKNITV
jgi:hypothetical protein